jgi:hypothetical protein
MMAVAEYPRHAGLTGVEPAKDLFIPLLHGESGDLGPEARVNPPSPSDRYLPRSACGRFRSGPPAAGHKGTFSKQNGRP